MEGCEKFFLILSVWIEFDFGDVLFGKGCEVDYFKVLVVVYEVGVKYVYYMSLVFVNLFLSWVMKVYEWIEEWLVKYVVLMKYIVICEGLYNESWFFYFGYYDVDGLKWDYVKFGGDGVISWMSIVDLGLVNSLILVVLLDEWVGKRVYLL